VVVRMLGSRWFSGFVSDSMVKNGIVRTNKELVCTCRKPGKAGEEDRTPYIQLGKHNTWGSGTVGRGAK